MASAQLLSWYLGRRFPAQIYWGGAYLAAFLSAINFLSRSSHIELVAVLSSQLTQFLTAYLMLMGVRSYMGLKPWPLRYGVSLALVLLSGVTFFTLVQPDPAVRIGLSSLVMSFLFGLCATTIAKGELRQFPARYIFAVPCGLHALFVLARIVHIYQVGDQASDLVQGRTIPPVFILESIIALVMMAFATLMLVGETITREWRALAELDPLTNTFNRRSFFKLLEQASSAANRRQAPFSLLLIDLDHFKQINDAHGHAVGDEALCHFVKVAAGCLRAEDVLGRLGGEEFAALLPDASSADALLIAERLRAKVSEQPLVVKSGEVVLTVSVGIAECQPGELPERTLQQADEAMYQAKRGGRNRVQQWQLSWP
jgi:diguanylate cyclase (GGDEF)-like protein